MEDLDPYDPAFNYPEEWGREERIAALKCWRDGDKTDARYWLKDHEWKRLHAAEILLTKNVTSAQMRQIEWALSDEKNTFIEFELACRRQGGVLYSKHGNEHIDQDYCEKSLRWDIRYRNDDRLKGIPVIKGNLDDFEYWAKTRWYLYFEWLGGTDLSIAEASALVPKFAYLMNAEPVFGYGTLTMRQVNRYIAAIRQRRVHRSTVWLVLHRAGIHEKSIHKTIFQQAGLF